MRVKTCVFQVPSVSLYIPIRISDILLEAKYMQGKRHTPVRQQYTYGLCENVELHRPASLTIYMPVTGTQVLPQIQSIDCMYRYECRRAQLNVNAEKQLLQCNCSLFSERWIPTVSTVDNMTKFQLN